MKPYVLSLFCLCSLGLFSQTAIQTNFCDAGLPHFSRANENGSFSYGVGTDFYGNRQFFQISQSIASPLYLSLGGSVSSGSIKVEGITTRQADYQYTSQDLGIGYTFRNLGLWDLDISYRNQKSTIEYYLEETIAQSYDSYVGGSEKHSLFIFTTSKERFTPIYGLGLTYKEITESFNHIPYEEIDMIAGPEAGTHALYLCPSFGIRAELSEHLLWTGRLSLNLEHKDSEFTFASFLLSTRLEIQWYRGDKEKTKQ